MCVLNDTDRYHLAIDVLDRVPGLAETTAHLRHQLKEKLLQHKAYIVQTGEDLPEITDWKWEL